MFSWRSNIKNIVFLNGHKNVFLYDTVTDQLIIILTMDNNHCLYNSFYQIFNKNGFNHLWAFETSPTVAHKIVYKIKTKNNNAKHQIIGKRS